MSQSLQPLVEQYFLQELGIALSTLLAPVSVDMPAGQSLRNTTVYSAIKKARTQDDPTLPLGAWEYELKRADWVQVSTLALNGLQQSKDMQLVAWLLEAQIHLKGLAGIAPCLVLMDRLCETFWEQIHPVDDKEFRCNIIRWIAEKLQPALYLVPLLEDGNNGYYNWSHWEQAQRNEQLRANAGPRNPVVVEGVSLQEITSRIATTPTEQFQAYQTDLYGALTAISGLSRRLDILCQEASPSMGKMSGLLEQMQSFVDAELNRRGVRYLSPAAVALDMTKDTVPVPDIPALDVAAPRTFRTREEAYATLAETAEFLIKLEPHSPVPYLVKRATEWGSLNTVELYQELFLRLNGQLNIFEMLGLEQQSRVG